MYQSYSRSFIKDNAIVIVGHILVYMNGIILMPIIIKTVGISVYGGFVLLSSVLGIIFGVSSFGTGFRAKRFMPTVKDVISRRNLFYPQFNFHMISILILSFLLLLLNKQINFYIFKNEINYSPLIIPLYLTSFLFYHQGCDYFRYTSRVKYMTIATILFPYLYIIFILLVYYYFNYININVLMFSQAFSAFIIAAPCFLIIFREIGVGFLFYSVEAIARDIKLGFPLILSFIVDFVLIGGDRYLIAYYISVTAVGYYNPGYVLGSLIIFIPKAMGTALPQLMSKAIDSKHEYEAQRMLNYAIKIYLLLAIPFVFGSLVFSKSILILIANTEVAENAWFVTPIVGLGSIFYGLNLIFSNVLFARMKTYAMFKMNVFASVFNLMANFLLLSIFRNIIVAAVTTFLSYFFAFIYIHIILKQEKWPVDFQPLVIGKAIFASVLMAILLFWISSQALFVHPIIIVIGSVTLGIVIYIIGLLALGTFSKKELQFLKGALFAGRQE